MLSILFVYFMGSSVGYLSSCMPIFRYWSPLCYRALTRNLMNLFESELDHSLLSRLIGWSYCLALCLSNWLIGQFFSIILLKWFYSSWFCFCFLWLHSVMAESKFILLAFIIIFWISLWPNCFLFLIYHIYHSLLISSSSSCFYIFIGFMCSYYYLFLYLSSGNFRLNLIFYWVFLGWSQVPANG